METLTMSRKERDRMTVMTGVKRQELTLVQAGGKRGGGLRPRKRRLGGGEGGGGGRGGGAGGGAGLVHRLRGQPSARRKPPELRARALARYAEERYADFGPTLMAEHLRKEKVVVDHETLRRWRLGRLASIRCGAGSKRTGNGGNASRALERWCNWTGRTTTGSRGAAPGAC